MYTFFKIWILSLSRTILRFIHIACSMYQVVSSHTRWSVLCRMIMHSLCIALLSGTLSCKLEQPWSPQMLSSVSSTQVVCWALPVITHQSPPCRWPCSLETLSRSRLWQSKSSLGLFPISILVVLCFFLSIKIIKVLNLLWCSITILNLRKESNQNWVVNVVSEFIITLLCWIQVHKAGNNLFL